MRNAIAIEDVRKIATTPTNTRNANLNKIAGATPTKQLNKKSLKSTPTWT